MGHMVKGQFHCPANKRNKLYAAALSVPSVHTRDSDAPDTVSYYVDSDDEQLLKDRLAVANSEDDEAPPVVAGGNGSSL